MIHTGVYRFNDSVVAYRNDYCLTCDSERIAEEIRTFDVYHVWFIPLIPVGFRRRWLCSSCGKDPHERPQTTLLVLSFWMVVLVAFAVLLWMPGRSPVDVMTWVMRIGSLVGLVAVPVGMKFGWIKYTVRAPDVKGKIAALPLLSRDHCIYCAGGLDRDCYCPKCDVRLVQQGDPYRRMW
jgi:hypothetical protein